MQRGLHSLWAEEREPTTSMLTIASSTMRWLREFDNQHPQKHRFVIRGTFDGGRSTMFFTLIATATHQGVLVGDKELGEEVII